MGDGVDFRPPFSLDYGHRLHLGARTFVNADFLTLGGGEIRIGADVLIGPSVRLYTPTHVLDPELRPQGWERVASITIEDGAWLGGSVVVCPGVTIGARSVVGAGSVVTKDVPPDVVVAGNPARVVRPLLPQD